MKIETLYNVGDKVYLVVWSTNAINKNGEHPDIEKYVPVQKTVEYITVFSNCKLHKRIEYQLSGCAFPYLEGDMYSNKKAAQKIANFNNGFLKG